MLIDSHCHLNYLGEGNPDAIGIILDEATRQGVSHCLCIGVELSRFAEVLDIGRRFNQVKVSTGVHPCAVSEMEISEAMSLLSSWLTDPEVVAVGECGLDYYHSENCDKSLQKEYFSRQIELSIHHEKPLVVHTRCARMDTIDILTSAGQKNARGVLHCFTESKEMATQALDLGFYIGFSGIITFKNAAELQDVVRHVPLDRILVETDAPYLAPVPYRGKQNQPAYVIEVAKQVALLKGIDFERVCQQTVENTETLFRWPVDNSVGCFS